MIIDAGFQIMIWRFGVLELLGLRLPEALC